MKLESKKYLPFLLGVVVAYCISSTNIVNFFADDAYFYVEIAKNIAEGRGVTFGIVYDTNGFHPLWLISLVPLAWLFEGGKVLLAAVFGLFAFCTVLSIYVGLEAAKRFNLGGYEYISMMPLTLVLCATGIYGSEAAISAFTITTTIALLVSFLLYKKNKLWVYLGASLGLMMLARLDTVFLAFFVVLLIFILRGFKVSFYVTCISSLIVIPYLAFNVYNFGHILPISGAVKSSFPHIGPHIGGTSFIHNIFILGIVVQIPVLYMFRVEHEKRLILLALSLGVILHFIYHFTFGESVSWYWYSIQSSIVLGILSSFTLKMIHRNIVDEITTYLTIDVRHIVGLGTILFFGFLLFINLNKVRENRIKETISMIEKIDDRISKKSLVLVGDMPGRFAYYTNTRVVALDGLTNNYKYLRELSRLGTSLFKKIGVDYIFLPIENKKSGVMYMDCDIGSRSNCKKGSVRLYNRSRRMSYVGQIPIDKGKLLFKEKNVHSGKYITVWKTKY